MNRGFIDSFRYLNDKPNNTAGGVTALTLEKIIRAGVLINLVSENLKQYQTIISAYRCMSLRSLPSRIRIKFKLI